MRAVRLVYRAELRRRWRSWLALALLVTLAGGTVLAAAAAGQRTSSAFPSFVARYGYDTEVIAPKPLPWLASSPEVAAVQKLDLYLCGNLVSGGRVAPVADTTLYEIPQGPSPPPVKLLSGRLPVASRPTDVLVSFTLSQQLGLRVGSVISVPFFAPDQASVFFTNSEPPPARGPTVKLTVVGIEASLADFAAGQPSFSMWFGPGFERDMGSQVATLFAAFVRLRHVPDAITDFSAYANGRAARAKSFVAVQDSSATDTAVEHSIHPQAIGWELLALLAGLAALAVVGQAFARQQFAQAESHPTLRALGVRPRELFWLGLLAAASVGLLGALGALGLAWALSPLTPVGVARVAAPSTGFVFDLVVLLVGVVAILLLCTALGAFTAWRSTRSLGDHRRSESVTAGRSPAPAGWRRTGAGPSALVGTRRAMQRGTGHASLPVGTALLGSSLAVTALVATAVFGASLTNLIRTPSLYGQAWQLQLAYGMTEGQLHSILTTVESEAAIDRVTFDVSATNVFTIGGITVPTLLAQTARGPLTFPVVGGRLPDGDRQIALGDSTLRQLGAHIGSVVPVMIVTNTGARTVPFEVVGTTSFAPVFGTGGLGDGAILTFNAAVAAICGVPVTATCHQSVEQHVSGSWGILLGAAPGPAGLAAVASIDHRLAPWVNLPVTPTDLVDFGQAVNFPLLLGIALALFGAATFTHLIVVSVARRRRDVGLLKALGFVRRQIAAAVGWHATTVAVVAVAVGVPVGIALGRLLWRAFALNLGAVSIDVVPVWVVVALAGGVLAAANLLAVLPAASAARLRPSEALRQA